MRTSVDRVSESSRLMLVAGVRQTSRRRMRVFRDLHHNQTFGAIIGLEPSLTAHAYPYAACGGASPCICRGAAKLRIRWVTLLGNGMSLENFQIIRQALKLIPCMARERHITRTAVPDCDPFATVVKVKH